MSVTQSTNWAERVGSATKVKFKGGVKPKRVANISQNVRNIGGRYSLNPRRNIEEATAG
jgi:hypothetical protein